jgi:hypothetical protein
VREIQKKRQKFLKLSQRIFIAQCRFFFYNILQGLKFFKAHFGGVQALVTLFFHAFFAFRPLKRAQKHHDDLKIQNFNHVKVSPKLLPYMISTSHARYLLRLQRENSKKKRCPKKNNSKKQNGKNIFSKTKTFSFKGGEFVFGFYKNKYFFQKQKNLLNCRVLKTNTLLLLPTNRH